MENLDDDETDEGEWANGTVSNVSAGDSAICWVLWLLLLRLFAWRLLLFAAMVSTSWSRSTGWFSDLSRIEFDVVSSRSPGTLREKVDGPFVILVSEVRDSEQEETLEAGTVSVDFCERVLLLLLLLLFPLRFVFALFLSFFVFSLLLMLLPTLSLFMAIFINESLALLGNDWIFPLSWNFNAKWYWTF